jgi:hypothetical protein
MNTTLTMRRTATIIPTMEQKLARTNMSKWQLITALTMQGIAQIVVNGVVCVLDSVQREDGSGNSFNLTLKHGGNRYSCYCRTTD